MNVYWALCLGFETNFRVRASSLLAVHEAGLVPCLAWRRADENLLAASMTQETISARGAWTTWNPKRSHLCVNNGLRSGAESSKALSAVLSELATQPIGSLCYMLLGYFESKLVNVRRLVLTETPAAYRWVSSFMCEGGGSKNSRSLP